MADVATVEIDPGIDAADIEKALEDGRSRIEKETGGSLAKLSWPMVRERLAGEIREQLGKDMMPWIASAWQSYEKLREFKDTEKYPPGTDSFFDMFPQTIEGAMHPEVTVSCEGADIAQLPFDLTVSANFHCISLVIRDAHIIGFGGGDYDIMLRIALFGQELSGPIELDKSRLPGKLTFARGLPIL